MGKYDYNKFRELDDKYKREVNLVEFAQSFGYTVDRKKTDRNRKWVKMKKTVNGYTVDRIIIAFNKDQGKYFYYNPEFKTDYFRGGHHEDKGSIIDFIQFRRQFSLGHVRNTIDSFLKNPSIKFEKFDLSPVGKVPSGINLFKYFGVDKLSDTKFLNSRGITDDVLQHRFFKGRVFNREFVNMDNETFSNTVFPIYGKDGVIGFYETNFPREGKEGSYKSIINQRANGLWTTNPDFSEPFDKLIVSETPIDAISHFILNPKRDSENNVYFSTIGSISKEQFHDLVSSAVEKAAPKELLTIFDNDIAGAKFSLKAIEYLPESTFLSPGFVNKNFENLSVLSGSYRHKGHLDFVFNNRTLKGNRFGIEALNTKLSQLNKEYQGLLSEMPPFELEEVQCTPKGAIARVNFRSVRENWFLMSDFAKEIRFGPSSILKKEVSVNKDFNTDLMIKENLLDIVQDNPVKTNTDFNNSYGH